ncbi:MAG: aminotransferase class I/II-fold pyridoxal phosphate-dependent enzyme [Spirochaetales bacterium]|nr:aminotransferase class I/II-fold pyridoxal phosphate-dependent enzyme [Spirochaetales bacterium]
MDRMDNISSFLVIDFLKKAREIPDVIHFEIGEPDIDPPPGVLLALEQAVKDKKIKYTESLGLLELREKISEHYYKSYKVNISPDRIILTVGTSGAFLVAYSICLNQNERIALTDPSYPCYRNFAYLLNIEPCTIPVDKNTAYQLLAKGLSKEKNIKAVHIPSPSNPFGSLHTPEVMEELLHYCDKKDIYFISDEIYHGLVYEKKEHTALEYSDKAIVINGFSKTYGLPGLRIGWMILPPQLVRKAEIVTQNISISVPTLSQYGALAAFDYPYLEKIRESYKKRRDYLYKEINQLFKVDAPPDGAFYLWADITDYSQDSLLFAQELLEKCHIAVTPGCDFGKNNTEKYIRFSYTKELNHLKEGITRLQEYLL